MCTIHSNASSNPQHCAGNKELMQGWTDGWMGKGPLDTVQYLILDDACTCAERQYISVHEHVCTCVCLQP